ncbi:MAG: hypothetical protein H8E20_08220 [Verrucomicrobia bacterium]|nr:hypothetical protein [Verrucomicrobiota bacterium]
MKDEGANQCAWPSGAMRLLNHEGHEERKPMNPQMAQIFADKGKNHLCSSAKSADNKTEN